MNKYAIRSLNGENVFLQFATNIIIAQSDGRSLMPALVAADPQDPSQGGVPLMVPFVVGRLMVVIDEKGEAPDVCYVTATMGGAKVGMKLYFDPEQVIYAQSAAAISVASPADFNGMPNPSQIQLR